MGVGVKFPRSSAGSQGRLCLNQKAKARLSANSFPQIKSSAKEARKALRKTDFLDGIAMVAQASHCPNASRCAAQVHQGIGRRVTDIRAVFVKKPGDGGRGNPEADPQTKRTHPP